jgi:hypothetical protein
MRPSIWAGERFGEARVIAEAGIISSLAEYE